MEPARLAIAGFTLTSANHESAVKLLKKRYGKKTAIQRVLVSELLNTRPVFNDSDTPRLRSLYDFAGTKYRELQALEVEEQTYSEIVVPMLLEKIPDSIRVTITRGKDYLRWTLGNMLEKLLTEVELREDHCLASTSRVRSSEGRKGPQTASALFTRRGEDGKCAFCLGNHPPEDSRKVTNTSERKKLLIKYGRCFKCIERGHRSGECKIMIECKM